MAAAPIDGYLYGRVPLNGVLHAEKNIPLMWASEGRFRSVGVHWSVCVCFVFFRVYPFGGWFKRKSKEKHLPRQITLFCFFFGGGLEATIKRHL